MSIKSGIPLHKWERLDESLPYYNRCPIVVGAGLGATFIENFCADNPRKGVGEDGMIDCFSAGTKVKTGNDTSKNIEDLKEGDVVQSYNVATGEIQSDFVAAVRTQQTDKLMLEMTFEENGETSTVHCTEDHQFLTSNRGWVQAKDLTAGDDIISY